MSENKIAFQYQVTVRAFGERINPPEAEQEGSVFCPVG